jgi:hypothetical protein
VVFNYKRFFWGIEGYNDCIIKIDVDAIKTIEWEAFIKTLIITLVAIVIVGGQTRYIPNAQSPYSTWKTDSLFVGANLAVFDSSKAVEVSVLDCIGDIRGKLFWCTDKPEKQLAFIFSKDTICNNGNNSSEVTGLGKNAVIRFIFAADSTYPGPYTNGKKLYSGPKNVVLYPENEGFKYGLVAVGKITEGVAEIGFDNGYGSYNELRLKITNVRLIKYDSTDITRTITRSNVISLPELTISFTPDNRFEIINNSSIQLQGATFSMCTISGRTLAKYAIQQNNVFNTTSFPLPVGLRKGTYLYRLNRSGKILDTRKFTVK